MKVKFDITASTYSNVSSVVSDLKWCGVRMEYYEDVFSMDLFQLNILLSVVIHPWGLTSLDPYGGFK